jgi:hypothetical protein
MTVHLRILKIKQKNIWGTKFYFKSYHENWLATFAADRHVVCKQETGCLSLACSQWPSQGPVDKKTDDFFFAKKTNFGLWRWIARIRVFLLHKVRVLFYLDKRCSAGLENGHEVGLRNLGFWVLIPTKWTFLRPLCPFYPWAELKT